MNIGRFLMAALVGLGWLAGLSRAAERPGARPAPDLANEPYGPHARHVLDLWKAKSEY